MGAIDHGSAWSAGLQRGTDAELDGWLEVAHGMCDAADVICLDALRGELRISAKDDGSFVTDADGAVERLIRERVADAFPEHGVVGEEYGDAGASAAVRWYVDPIDGTHNFMRGVPVFATLLGVERDGELQAGMISAPGLGRRWWARRGGGAWVHDVIMGGQPRRLRVSDRAHLATSQLVYGATTDMLDSRVGRGFETLLRDVWRERAFGDFWGYALVADAAAELMMEPELHVWDIAAPWVVVEEAGGRVSDFDGRRDWHAGEAFASNGLLHEQVLERLHG
jgi:histidinol-phosphatase